MCNPLGIIDKSLNYGRTQIQKFIKECPPASKIIDLGAGKGNDLLNAKMVQPSADLMAIETYPPNIEFLEEQGIKVHSVNLETDKFPFPDESVDVIIVNQVLEHVKEVFWIFHEMTRVLKTGGHLIVGVPNLASWHNRALLLVGRQPTCIKNNSAHVRGYTKGDFMRLADSGHPDGYKLVGLKGGNFYPFPPFLAVPLAWMFPAMAAGLFMKIKKMKPYQSDGYLKYPVENRLETNFFLGK